MNKITFVFMFLLAACGDDDRPRPQFPDGSVARQDAGADSCTEAFLAQLVLVDDAMSDCLDAATHDNGRRICWSSYGDQTRFAREDQAQCYESMNQQDDATYVRCCSDCSEHRADCVAAYYGGDRPTRDDCDSTGARCRDECSPLVGGCEADTF